MRCEGRCGDGEKRGKDKRGATNGHDYLSLGFFGGLIGMNRPYFHFR
jgi:hypothetical protein